MFLYHFTNYNIDVLKVKYFAKNHYTSNDAKYPLKRLFFYDSLQPKEYHLNGCEYRYTVKIPKRAIYNLDIDRLSLKDKFNYEIDDILNYIKGNFKGCCYTTSFKCYVIFEDIKPINKKELIRG